MGGIHNLDAELHKGFFDFKSVNFFPVTIRVNENLPYIPYYMSLIFEDSFSKMGCKCLKTKWGNLKKGKYKGYLKIDYKTLFVIVYTLILFFSVKG